MRKCTLYLLCCIIVLSCTKEQVEDYVVIPAPTATSGQIEINQVVNDSTIVLKWTKYTGGHFQKYQLVRTASYVKDGRFGTYSEPVDSSTDVNHLSFTESKMPLAHEVHYNVYVQKSNMPIDPGLVFFGQVSYQRPKSLVYGLPTDVLISKQRQWLYIIEQNKISVVNYFGRVLITKAFPVSIGFCALGNFNGSEELYVPVNDGWVHILDAATLDLKERIYVAGYEIGSVLAVNGKLYVSSSDKSVGGYSNCIKVYDRATKTLIGRTGYWDKTRLLLLESGDVEMIDLTISIIPVGLHYYQFSAEGAPLVKKEDGYHGQFEMSANIARSFPDGSKFITSSYGTIFNKALGFDRYVKPNGNYSDFAFNSDGSKIYAAYASEKKIDVVSYPTTTTISSHSTNFFPFKIFRDGNTLVSVGKTSSFQQPTYLLVEIVNL